jgi:hypothetical protein
MQRLVVSEKNETLRRQEEAQANAAGSSQVEDIERSVNSDS